MFCGSFNSPVNLDPEKAAVLMVVTVCGISRFPWKFAPWKARWPIETRFGGRVNLPEQPRLENVWSSITVICDGIVKSPVKLEQPVNAEPPIDVTVSGIVNLPSNPEQ